MIRVFLEKHDIFLFHIEHIIFIPYWRWKPLLIKGKRMVKVPWPMSMNAWMLRWGFWQLHCYSDRPI